jgi:hypothetical protein
MNQAFDPQLDAQAHKMLPDEPVLTRTPVALSFDDTTRQGWLYYGADGFVCLTRFALFPGGPPTEMFAERQTYADIGRARMSAKRFTRTAHISFAIGIQIEGERPHIENLANLSAIILGS